MSLIPYALARPVLFGMDAEAAHDLTLDMLAKGQGTPLQWAWCQETVADPIELANADKRKVEYTVVDANEVIGVDDRSMRFTRQPSMRIGTRRADVRRRNPFPAAGRASP